MGLASVGPAVVGDEEAVLALRHDDTPQSLQRGVLQASNHCQHSTHSLTAVQTASQLNTLTMYIANSMPAIDGSDDKRTEPAVGLRRAWSPAPAE